MINLRHTGVYVKNLMRMASFYREVFHMHTICENFRQADALIADLLRMPEACVKITKLITEQGEANGTGDMIELIEIVTPEEKAEKIPQPIAAGMHVAFGVRDMETTRTAIHARGGICVTRVHDMVGGNQCCFCRDPEGNWLELIARNES